MHLELRRRGAEGSQCRDGGDLAAAEIEPGAGVDVAERELDPVAGEIRGDGGERRDDLRAGLSVNPGEGPLPAVVAALVGGGLGVRHPASPCRSGISGGLGVEDEKAGLERADPVPDRLARSPISMNACSRHDAKPGTASRALQLQGWPPAGSNRHRANYFDRRVGRPLTLAVLPQT